MAKDGIFELNGKAYDALTGELLGDARHIQRNTTVQHMPIQSTPAPQQHRQHQPPVVIGGLSAPHAASAGRNHYARQTAANHVSAHQPQPTKTLMRRAVKQPAPQLATAKPSAAVHAQSGALRTARTASPVAATAQQAAHIKSTPSTTPAARIHRANEAPRSQAVQHFRPLDFRPLKSSAAATAPKPATPRQAAPPTPQPIAAPRPTVHSDIKLVHPPTSAANQQQTRSTIQQRQLQQIRHMRRPAATTATSASRPPHHMRPTAARPHAVTGAQKPANNDHDIFAQALAQATSHEQPAPKESKLSKMKHKGKKRKRALGIAVSLAIFLSLCGFAALQNRENIQLQIAGAKAGFSVATPLYKPDGYKLDKLTYSAGSVASLYKSLGSQSFTVSQKKSNWDSQTLLENFVATSGEDYKGFQSNGRTVYVYGKGKATWVNGGIWYQIQGANELTDEQLVKIAASM